MGKYYIMFTVCICTVPLLFYSFGLNILYQGEMELNDLLKLVLTEGNLAVVKTYNLILLACGCIEAFAPVEFLITSLKILWCNKMKSK